MKNIKIPWVVAVFLIVLLAGLGLHRVYFQQKVMGPLATDALDIPGVVSVDIVEATGGKRDVRAVIKKDAALDRVYPTLQWMAEDALGTQFGQLSIADQSNDWLDQALHRIHFAVQEAIVTGRFVRMADVIADRLRPFELDDYQVTVTEDFVFLKLEKDEYFRISVVPRTD